MDATIHVGLLYRVYEFWFEEKTMMKKHIEITVEPTLADYLAARIQLFRYPDDYNTNE